MSAPPVLEDVLPPGARVLFCGTAAGTVSARVGAPYAGPGNAFWPTLHEVGLLPAPLQPSAFREAAGAGIALTDLDKRASGSDAEIGRAGFDPAAVAAKTAECGARIVAFTSKTAGAEALGGPVDYGRQSRRFGGAEAWVLPSPSGRARRFWDLAPWRALADRVRALAPVVLCAPDKLRGALDASAAAAVMARGVRDAGGWPVELPVADGGEGTLDAFLAGGRADAVVVRVRDALGRPVDARIGVLREVDGTGPAAAAAAARHGAASDATPVQGVVGAPAPDDVPTGRALAGAVASTPTVGASSPTVVVEAAEAIALAGLADDERDVDRASSAGVGDLLLAALDLGAARILVTVGGSASMDGGGGMLRALGIDAPADGAGLLAGAGAVEPSLAGLDPRLRDVAIELLHDVDAPLCGPDGAAHRFGPQKGASPEQVPRYDAALSRWAAALAVDPDRPGSGAAGGLGLALMALGARPRPGADAVLELVGFAALAAHADLVLTAEGSVDRSTLQGKAVDAVVRAAVAGGTPVAVLGGRVEDEAASALRVRGARDVVALGPAGRPLHEALAGAAMELRDGDAGLVRALQSTEG